MKIRFIDTVLRERIIYIIVWIEYGLAMDV
jgi:hypothetical protein